MPMDGAATISAASAWVGRGGPCTEVSRFAGCFYSYGSSANKSVCGAAGGRSVSFGSPPELNCWFPRRTSASCLLAEFCDALHVRSVPADESDMVRRILCAAFPSSASSCTCKKTPNPAEVCPVRRGVERLTGRVSAGDEPRIQERHRALPLRGAGPGSTGVGQGCRTVRHQSAARLERLHVPSLPGLYVASTHQYCVCADKKHGRNKVPHVFNGEIHSRNHCLSDTPVSLHLQCILSVQQTEHHLGTPLPEPLCLSAAANREGSSTLADSMRSPLSDAQ